MSILNCESLANAIENRMNSDIALCNIGGASVLVAQDGNVIYKNHFGSEITEGTLYRLASLTKPIAAAATMILVDRGLLSLDDTVEAFYPEFSRMTVYGSDSASGIEPHITIKHILTHTSAIGSGAAWDASYRKMTENDMKSAESFIKFISEQPISFVPGTKQEYSGIAAFSVLTGIIQRITDMPYLQFLKKELFDPCNMTDTTFEPTKEQWGRLIAMHNKADGKSVTEKMCDGCVFEKFPVNNHLGGAGLISSLGDYFNFASMLLCGGVFEGKRILSNKAVSEISKEHFYKNPAQSWGFGVRVVSGDASNVLPSGAYGWSGAYGTHFWIDPSNRIIGIYMKNSKYDGGSGAVTSSNFERDVYASLL